MLGESQLPPRPGAYFLHHRMYCITGDAMHPVLREVGLGLDNSETTDFRLSKPKGTRTESQSVRLECVNSLLVMAMRPHETDSCAAKFPYSHKLHCLVCDVMLAK